MSNVNNSPPAFAISAGGYVGDGSANKAIAHGLGRTPKLVIIIGVGNNNIWIINTQGQIITCSGAGQLAVQVPDNTNFYVGNAINLTFSANWNAEQYYWVAL